MYAFSQKWYVWSPNPQCDGIWRFGGGAFWGGDQILIRSGGWDPLKKPFYFLLSHLQNQKITGLLKKPDSESSHLFYPLQGHRTGPHHQHSLDYCSTLLPGLPATLLTRPVCSLCCSRRKHKSLNRSLLCSKAPTVPTISRVDTQLPRGPSQV